MKFAVCVRDDYVKIAMIFSAELQFQQMTFLNLMKWPLVCFKRRVFEPTTHGPRQRLHSPVMPFGGGDVTLPTARCKALARCAGANAL